MTEVEKAEFVRLTEENEDFKTAIKAIVKGFSYVQTILGTSLNQIKSFEDIMNLAPDLMIRWQMGEFDIEQIIHEFTEIKDLMSLFEKYKHLVIEDPKPEADA